MESSRQKATIPGLAELRHAQNRMSKTGLSDKYTLKTLLPVVAGALSGMEQTGFSWDIPTYKGPF